MSSPKIISLSDLIALGKTTFTTASNSQINLYSGNLIDNAKIISFATIAHTARAQCIGRLEELKGVSSRTGDDLIDWGIAIGCPILQAKSASGFLIFQTTLGIPENTEFLINGNSYICYTAQSLYNWEIVIASSSYDPVSNATTVLLNSDTDLAQQLPISLIPGIKIKLKNSPNTEYVVATVLARNQFTIIGNFSTNLIAGVHLVYTSYRVPVTAKQVGSAMNVAGLTSANSDKLPNILGYVDISGIYGGLDKESDVDYRARLINRSATANKGIFNDYGFKRFLEDNGLNYQYKVWRAYKELLLTPGWSTTYLLHKDNTPLTVTELNHILDLFYDTETGLAYPNESRTENRSLFLNANTSPIDININGLVPDYQSLREAIENRLRDFFLNEVTIGDTSGISIAELEGIIYSSLDNNNNKPKDFIITNPTSNLSCARNERLIFGKLTWGNAP